MLEPRSLSSTHLRRTIAWLMVALLSTQAFLREEALASTPAASKARLKTLTVPKAVAATKRPDRTELIKPVRRHISFPANPSDIDIWTASLFTEPLVPMDSKVIPAENRALAQALLAFDSKNDPENTSALTGFLSTHPKSRWRASLEMDLGQLRFQCGYLTDALSYWTSAWEISKRETARQRKAVADEAISRLVLLEARLGLTGRLQKHLSEIANRPLSGSVEQRVKAARDGLWTMQHDPGIAFRCGPLAVNDLAAMYSKAVASCDTIRRAKSTKLGTNLAQLEDWAQTIGLKLQMAKRTAGSPVLVPAVMHWKAGHFAAILAEDHGRYRVHDATFGDQGNFLLSKSAIESQTDGYCLVPAGRMPPGWRQVDRTEASTVWGKGGAGGRIGQMGPDEDKDCLSAGTCCNKNGMPQASVFSMEATLNIQDTPVGYSPPLGPAMNISVNYNYTEGNQPSSWTFTNIGPDWSLNWVSYLQVSGSTITVNVPGGGYEVYTSPYTESLTSQCQIVNLGGGSYQRLHPDGSAENYTLSRGSYTLMTSMLDPHGNAAIISYDANFRITGITDACANPQTTFAYVSNTVGNAGFYKVASITDGFGRSASFSYDSTTTNLTSLTDAAGNVSQFSYDPSSSFIRMMTTPYGSTAFYQYTPTGGSPSYPPLGLRTTFPDGTSAVLENWIDEQKATYFWDREATALYPSDPANLIYSHCKSTRWLWDSATSNEAPVANWIRKPLESPVIYTYPGELHQDYNGTSNKPTQIARQWSGFRTNATIGGTVTPGNVLTIQVTDGLLTYFTGSINFSYTVKSGDTLASIAAGLAAAMNSNGRLQSYGITATSASSVLTMTSLSTNATAYSNGSAGSPTETITFALGANPAETATLGGTATFGDVLTLTVHDSGLSGGQESVSYTVGPLDTLALIAQGLAIAINSDTNLQGINVTAVWNVPSSGGPIVSLQSNSANSTTYTESTSGGATETITLHTPTLSTANGIVQAWNYSRNALGYITQAIDPVGRQFSYTYAPNSIDLSEIQETQGGDTFAIGQWTYDTYHRPTSYVDGSGNRTSYTYNGLEQLTEITDANGNTTTMRYLSSATATMGGTVTPGDVLTLTVTDAGLSGGSESDSYTVQSGDTLTSIASGLTTAINGDSRLQAIGVSATSAGAIVSLSSLSVNVTLYSKSTSGGATETITLSIPNYGYLSQIQGPLSGNADVTNFTFYGFGLVKTVTDSEGYVLSYSYDNLNRLTSVNYPDGTSEQTMYDKLDAVLRSDRLGRWTKDTYDRVDQLVCEVDPLGRTTHYCWCACGSLASLTDPAGNVTSWNHDLEGRVTQKVYADQSAVSYSYQGTVGLLASKTDALSQVTNYDYNLDNTLQYTYYTNAVNTTSPVILGYDTNFPRTFAVTNGWGQDFYAYNPYVSATTNKSFMWIGGYPQTPNATDTISITFHNAALSGGQYTMPTYSVLAGDAGAPALVAAHLASTITSNSTLSAAGISATASGTLITITNPFAASSNVTVGTNPSAMAITPNGSTAYVCNNGSGTVTPITTSTNTAGTAITVGTSPTAIAIDPSGSTAYVCNNGSGTVTPITTSTNTAGTAITVGTSPAAIAITPSGSTAYVCNNGSGTVTPISTSTNTAGTAITVGTSPAAIAITPTGTTAYVCNNGSGTVTPITTSTNTAGTAITVGTSPAAIAIIPTGFTAYVCNSGSGTVTPITTSTNTAGTAITVGTNPTAIAITPNGSTAYICNKGSGTVTPINTYTNTAGTAITVGTNPSSIAITPDGNYAFVANSGSNTVSVISTATNTVVKTISSGTSPGQGLQAVVCMPTGDAAYVSNYGSANVTPITGGSVAASATGSTTATTGGGGRLSDVVNSVISNSVVSYSYDALGRTANRMINGANNSDSWVYDAMSRITSEQNVLGTFNYAYVDDTSGSSKGTLRLASITYPNTQATNFSYLPNIGDQRLQQITNLGPTPSPPTLSKFNYGYDSAGEITQWLQTQNSTTTHLTPGYDSASQLTSAPSDSGSTFNVYISGTPQAGDVVSVTAYDASLTSTTPPGQETASYTVMSGDTSSTIATALASAIGTAMSNVSVTASSSGSIITIKTSGSYATSFSSAVGGTTPTDTIALSGASPEHPFSNQLYYAYDPAGNRTAVQGNSTGSFPSGLTTSVVQSTYNNVNELTGTGPGGSVTFQGTTVNPVKSAVINVTQTGTISGTSVTPGDKVTLVVHNSALSAGEVVSYTVLSGDTYTSIATALTSAINADSTLSSIGVTATSSGAVVTVNSSSVTSTTYSAGVSSGATETITLGGSLSTAAKLNWSESFSGTPTLSVGANTASVTAVSGGGTPATNTYPITVSSVSSQTLTYDANGNLTNDGTNSYAWDVENRLIKITYPGTGNYTTMAYDGLGRRTQILEYSSSSLSSTKNFVWCGTEMTEARDASYTVSAQYFSGGQTLSGSNYFSDKDHLGSIREMTNGSGTIVYQQSFDPYGRPTVVVSTTSPDFGYAKMYVHARSGLNLTMYRGYSPTLGRWISRDPIREAAGTNLFAYVQNIPIQITDPLGLRGIVTVCAKSMGFSHPQQGESGPGHCWITWAPDTGATQAIGMAGTWGTWGGIGLQHNAEVDLPADACVSLHISDAAEAALSELISSYGDLGSAGWTGDENCCKFAHDAWRAATSEDLPWEIFGVGSPNRMINSIRLSGP